MGIFDKLLKPIAPPPSSVKANEGCVLIYIQGEEWDPMAAAQDNLMALLDDSEIGMFDGNEIGGDETVLFMYGPNAEALYNFVEPTLQADSYFRGAKAIIRQGPPQSPYREVIL
jgi:hypothetical protein